MSSTTIFSSVPSSCSRSSSSSPLSSSPLSSLLESMISPFVLGGYSSSSVSLYSTIFVEGNASATILAVGFGRFSFRNTSSAGGFDKGSFRLALDGSGSASVEESLKISSSSVCIFGFFYLLGSPSPLGLSSDSVGISTDRFCPTG